MKEPSIPMSGGCVCRRVRYEVRVEPLTLVVCHCSGCQRRTGSAFSMNMPVMREGFVLTEGATITRDLPGASGALLTQHFCEHCLVRTHSEPHAFPTVTYVRPGTLDDPSRIQPAAQLWTSEAFPWACLEGVERFDGNAPDAQTLLHAFQRLKSG